MTREELLKTYNYSKLVTLNLNELQEVFDEADPFDNELLYGVDEEIEKLISNINYLIAEKKREVLKMSKFKKLANIQRKLIAPKGQTNTFGKYNYRSCEDILKALKPLCEENNCMVYINNELECIGDRNYVKATVHFIDLDDDSEIVASAHAREEETKKGMDGSQITGASSSYARKYALAGLFCIDNEKDSDATNGGDLPKGTDSTPVSEAELRSRILKYANSNEDPKAVLKWIKDKTKKDASDLNEDECNEIINTLQAKGKDI